MSQDKQAMAAMIKDFPELAKGLDVAELGRIVSWITRNHSFESKPHRNSQ